MGIYALYEKNVRDAVNWFFAGLETSDAGCPDFKSKFYLELAKLEESGPTQIEYLTKCIDSAREHARYIDKGTCLREAGLMLLTYEKRELHRLGQASISEAQEYII